MKTDLSVIGVSAHFTLMQPWRIYHRKPVLEWIFAFFSENTVDEMSACIKMLALNFCEVETNFDSSKTRYGCLTKFQHRPRPGIILEMENKYLMDFTGDLILCFVEKIHARNIKCIPFFTPLPSLLFLVVSCFCAACLSLEDGALFA